MKICVFDTETTSLTKPFTYNIGYLIADTDTRKTLVKRSYVVEQVWHNLALFSSAYYADKRPIYVNAMRSRKTLMEKFGYICKQMRKDFKDYNVELAFAYNSPFDEKVFEFNCDWFKCINPFDEVPIRDIRGFVHHYLMTKDYKDFCECNEYFTESGNYSTTAETVYRYLFDGDFEEAHTALADAEIEAEILFHCVELGADIAKEYSTFTSIKRDIEKILELTDRDKKTYKFPYNSIRVNKEKTKIILK